MLLMFGILRRPFYHPCQRLPKHIIKTQSGKTLKLRNRYTFCDRMEQGRYSSLVCLNRITLSMSSNIVNRP